MDLTKLTSLAQEALQKAQELAQENQHQVLDTGHMLMGLLTVDKEVRRNILSFFRIGHLHTRKLFQLYQI